MESHLEHDVNARGDVYVVIALDLAPFVQPESRRDFEYVRGRRSFDDYLESLDLSGSCFERDMEYTKLEQKGFDLEIFSQLLFRDSFAPTYKVDKKRVEFPAHVSNNVQFRDFFLPMWEKWNIWFRLTRNGIVTLVMQRNIKQRRRLAHISKDMLDVQRNFDIADAEKKIRELQAGIGKPGENREEKIRSVNQFISWVNENLLVEAEKSRPPVLWQMAVAVIRQFIRSCGGHLQLNSSTGFDIALTEDISAEVDHPLRERFVIYHFDEMSRYVWSDKRHEPLAPKDILEQEDYARLISAMLEGVIIESGSDEKTKKHEYFYPLHSARSARSVVAHDASSWQKEFCLVTPHSAAIYSTAYETNRIVFPSQQTTYADYWRCIIRELEFAVETKVLARVTERATSEQMEEALPLFRSNSQTPARKMHDFSSRVANTNRLVANLRTLCIPDIIFRSSYASDKYRSFVEQTGINQIHEHAEANLRDLTAIIERYYDMQLQTESQRANEAGIALSIIFAGLTFTVALLGFPSFMQDWQEQIKGILGTRPYYPILPCLAEAVVVILIIISPVILTLGFNKYRNAYRRRKENIW